MTKTLAMSLAEAAEAMTRRTQENVDKTLRLRTDGNLAELLSFLIDTSSGLLASRVDEGVASIEATAAEMKKDMSKFQSEQSALILGAIKAFMDQAAEVTRLHHDLVALSVNLKNQLEEFNTKPVAPAPRMHRITNTTPVPTPAPVPAAVVAPTPAPTVVYADDERYPLTLKRAKIVQTINSLTAAGAELNTTADLRQCAVRVPGCYSPTSLNSIGWTDETFKGMSWTQIRQYAQRHAQEAAQMFAQ